MILGGLIAFGNLVKVNLIRNTIAYGALTICFFLRTVCNFQINEVGINLEFQQTHNNNLII